MDILKYNLMIRILLLGIILCACTLQHSGYSVSSGPHQERSKDSELTDENSPHRNLLTIDAHVDIPLNFASPDADPGVNSDAPVNLQKMEKGGLDTVFFNVYIGQSPRTVENYKIAQANAKAKLESIHRMTEVMYPERIQLAYTADDVIKINKSGKLVAMIGMENGFAIGKNLSLIEEFRRMGVRYITLSHTGHNDIADSSNPVSEYGDVESEHGGISAFGRQVIREMNRLGILVDVSHTSKEATLQAAKLSKAPIIASHSNVKALVNNPRNMDDEQLYAVKETNGVVNVTAYPAYVRMPDPEKKKAIDDLDEQMGFTNMATIGRASGTRLSEYRRRLIALDERWPRPGVSELVDHIDYIVQLLGIDHVGISSDFPAGGLNGWMDASESENITTELMRRGYSQEAIQKIWGDNLLRVIREAEKD